MLGRGRALEVNADGLARVRLGRVRWRCAPRGTAQVDRQQQQGEQHGRVRDLEVEAVLRTHERGADSDRGQCEDDGDTYYYNDATGESRWEPPLKAGAGGRGSVVTVTPGGEAPPVPPPQFESTVKESAVEMMAE